MQARTDFYTASPDAMKAMLALEAAVGKLSIELPLLELVRLRVSQINGCAFCLDMHTADARKGARPSVACTPCRPGVKRRSSPP